MPGGREDRLRDGGRPGARGPGRRRVYVRTQNSGDPESGEMFRMALVLKNEERGVLIKLPGSVTADPAHRPAEERRSTSNPQLPVSKYHAAAQGRPARAAGHAAGVRDQDATRRLVVGRPVSI